MSSFSSPSPGPSSSPPFSVASPADILSYVPHALGFLPRESLVLLTMSGRRLGATLRVDLPPDDADPLAFTRGLLSFLEGDAGADGALLIVYSRQVWHPSTPPPHQALISALGAVLGSAGLTVLDGWFVSDTAWRDYFCDDQDCCSWPGRPLDAVTDSALNAELVFGGSAVDASAPAAVERQVPAVGAGSHPLPPEHAEIRSARASFAASCRDLWTEERQFHATSALWDAVLEGTLDPDALPEVAGFLLASVESRTVRDFLLASACLGSDAALAGAMECSLLHPRAVRADAAAERGGEDPCPSFVLPGGAPPQVLWSVGRTTAASGRTAPSSTNGSAVAGGRDRALQFADVLAGQFTGYIMWSRVDAMSDVLGGLVAAAEGESRAAVLTMSGWFEYARGRGSRAAVFLDAAERAVPGYRLARLLHELLRRGGLPEWARTRATAWTADPATAGRQPRRAG
ncbi:DUF4192 domain-containing protein [Arthrobacter agilis]|uniref:DUF4192 domain-containing protein n=1 Tax=Arthrobacter agilis TaxID=37921 RepID=UPI000B35B6DC|nr:DUF4192 domain-containing protein [Arthrobacter agilis]OUM44984.1 hypothetical protein B8W74_01680 [Arthrobacter agilis]PPB46949.1 DUF4192 domain-containing protein [Arthrobacter agilis]TPV23457.1 DUF4192 domain-containing protein [Arthrobacter agilis]VDR31843.1 Uncharacterised protein [Arthrobacter agilis]